MKTKEAMNTNLKAMIISLVAILLSLTGVDLWAQGSCEKLFRDYSNAPSAVRALVFPGKLAQRVLKVAGRIKNTIIKYNSSAPAELKDNQVFFDQAQIKVDNLEKRLEREKRNKNSLYSQRMLSGEIQNNIEKAQKAIREFNQALVSGEYKDIGFVTERVLDIAKALDFQSSEVILENYLKMLDYHIEKGSTFATHLKQGFDIDPNPYNVLRQQLQRQDFLRFSFMKRSFLDLFIKDMSQRVTNVDWKELLDNGYSYPIFSFQRPNQTTQLEAAANNIHIITISDRITSYDEFNYAIPSMHAYHDFIHRLHPANDKNFYPVIPFNEHIIYYSRQMMLWPFTRDWLLNNDLSSKEIYSVIHLFSTLYHEAGRVFDAKIEEKSINHELGIGKSTSIGFDKLVYYGETYGEPMARTLGPELLREGIRVRARMMKDYDKYEKEIFGE